MDVEDAGASKEASPDRSGAQAWGLIGRAAEVRQLTAVIERRGPAIIVVTGAVGMGKSSLLREIQSWNNDWKIIPRLGQPPISIQPGMTQDTFASELRGALSVDGALDCPPPSAFASVQSTHSGYLQPLVEELRRRAPVMLLIDGFQPKNSFAIWFAQHFVVDIRRSGAAIMVIIADRDAPSVAADETVMLGPLDAHAVAAHFEYLRRGSVPLMEPAEFSIYVEAMCREPKVIKSLKSVLELAIALQ